MIYIGIDIAKSTHFASVVNSDGEVLINPFSFENSKNGFNLFLSKIKNFQIDDCLIGLESTGHYGDNLVCFLYPKRFKIGLINPIQTDSLRSSNIRKTKNDKVDTFLIIFISLYCHLKNDCQYFFQFKITTLSALNPHID